MLLDVFIYTLRHLKAEVFDEILTLVLHILQKIFESQNPESSKSLEIRNIRNSLNLQRLVVYYTAIYLNLSGNLCSKCCEALKSDSRSEQSLFGSKQSRLSGHHSRCFRDCIVALGSRTSSTTFKFNLKKINGYFIDPRPSKNQSTSLKSGSLYLLMVSVRPSVHNAPIKEFNHFSS